MIILYTIFAQIVLESLPISSSTHLRLLALPSLSKHFEEFIRIFTVVLLVLYFSSPLINIFKKSSWQELRHYCFCIILANCVTASMYFLVIPHVSFSLTVGLLITSFMLISTKFLPQKTASGLTLSKACLIGFAQGCALLPGISRLAITYCVGRWLQLSAVQSFYFSCAIQVPLFGAGALKGFALLLAHRSFDELYVFGNGSAVVFLMGAMIIAYYLLRLLEYLISTNRIWYFGIYLLVPFCVVKFLH